MIPYMIDGDYRTNDIYCGQSFSFGIFIHMMFLGGGVWKCEWLLILIFGRERERDLWLEHLLLIQLLSDELLFALISELSWKRHIIK